MMIPNLHFLFLFLRLAINQLIKRWSKPATGGLTAGLLTDLTRSRTDLLVENALLRQQLIILNRRVRRPQLKNSERIRLVSLARLTNFWQQALHIVQPDTLLRWHRTQVSRIVKQYAAYYNLARPHQGIHQQIPEHCVQFQRSTVKCSRARIISQPVLGGLHHHYCCAPRLN